MKPHPRIRKTVKWGGALLTVLLVVVWVGSDWRDAVYRNKHGFIRVVQGGVRVLRVGPGDTWGGPQGWSCSTHPLRFLWWPYVRRESSLVNMFIPLWPLALMTLMGSATAWWLDSRASRLARRPLDCRAS